MKVCAQIAGVALLMVVGLVPTWAAQGCVSGMVRNSAGTPQIGAQVELLRSDLTVVASVYTNAQGRFLISSVLPGRYAVKAMGTAFLPSLREDVRVRGSQTVVNLTLNTLYEVLQWLPAEPRSSSAQSDDWEWTLRSAANRPLLRWLEDGPLVVVTDGKRAAPKLKARLMATGQEGTFGESGERITATVQVTPKDSRELLAQVDFAPDTDAGMESMLGFSQDLGITGSVQSMAEVSVHPEVLGVGEGGVQEFAIESREMIHLGDMADAEIGANQVLVLTSDGVRMQSLPHAAVGWRVGDSRVGYRFATAVEGKQGSALPRVAERDGHVALEHGVHNEIGWEGHVGKTDLAMQVFADRVENPVLEARLRRAGSGLTSNLVYDPRSGLARVSAPDYGSTGIQANVERRIAGATVVRAGYASGIAVVMPALPRQMFDKAMTASSTRRVETYSISLSGTLEGTGTRWRASYRWQPEGVVTEVAPFAMEAIAPYLNLHICQKLHPSHEGGTNLEALVDVRNLLAEGYRPFLLSDGSTLVFAQNQRALRAGLVFTF